MIKVVNLIGPLCKDLRDIEVDLPTILVDGALKWKSHFKNALAVGDGDSFKEQTGQFGEFDYAYSPDKDETDLRLALFHLAQNFQFDQINAYGFLGERRDHELANFFEFCHFLENQKQKIIRLPYDEKKLISFYSPGFYEFFHTGVFSLFTLRQQAISLSGEVRYAIDAKNSNSLPLTGLGISNEAFGNVKLRVESATIWYGPV